jgi:Flp pilus assembly pilin Flp
MSDQPRIREAGQTMVEYAVVLGVISVALVLSLTLFGDQIRAGIERAASLVPH